MNYEMKNLLKEVTDQGKRDIEILKNEINSRFD